MVLLRKCDVFRGKALLGSSRLLQNFLDWFSGREIDLRHSEVILAINS